MYYKPSGETVVHTESLLLFCVFDDGNAYLVTLLHYNRQKMVGKPTESRATGSGEKLLRQVNFKQSINK